jgi:hypothetical protein
MNVEASTAEIVERQTGGQPVAIYLCLTSVYDVAQFLVAALDIRLQNWPAEFRMQGDQLTVAEVLQWAESVRGGELSLLRCRIQAGQLTTIRGIIRYRGYTGERSASAS